MSQSRNILNAKRFELTLDRLCHQLIEKYDDFYNTCFVGIQTGGVHLGERIFSLLNKKMDVSHVPFGRLDITFYRDDFRTRDKPLKAFHTEINFLVENKKVILFDDVLYTGRTVQSALTALNHYGRPERVDLMCLVDRRFNRELPIESNFIGMVVDSVDKAYVSVEWKNIHGQDKIIILND